MAFHNSTPASVLNAPRHTYSFVSEQPYMNRAARRHGTTKEGGKRYIIPKAQQAPSLNEPYTKGKRS